VVSLSDHLQDSGDGLPASDGLSEELDLRPVLGLIEGYVEALANAGGVFLIPTRRRVIARMSRAPVSMSYVIRVGSKDAPPGGSVGGVFPGRSTEISAGA
jgi:hypothetical protein